MKCAHTNTHTHTSSSHTEYYTLVRVRRTSVTRFSLFFSHRCIVIGRKMQSMCTLQLLLSQKRTNLVTTCRASSAWARSIFRMLSLCRMHVGLFQLNDQLESTRTRKSKNNFDFSHKLMEMQ